MQININARFSTRIKVIAGFIVILSVAGLTARIVSPILAAKLSGIERKMTVVENAWPDGAIELVRIHNLQSSSFPNDFKVEVKNISSKPIYFIVAAVTMPDSGRYLKPSASFIVRFGNPRFGKRENLANPDDASIKPGETAILTLDSPVKGNFFDAWPNGEEVRKNGTSNIRLLFQMLSHGDGEGYFLNNKYSAHLPSDMNMQEFRDRNTER